MKYLKLFENFEDDEPEEEDDIVEYENPDYDSDLCDCFHSTEDGIFTVQSFKGKDLIDLCLDCFQEAELIEHIEPTAFCPWQFYSQSEEDKYFKRK